MTMRPCWVEISTQSLAHNYDYLKSLAAGEAELLAVVKSDAYGHSLPLCSAALVRAGASLDSNDQLETKQHLQS